MVTVPEANQEHALATVCCLFKTSIRHYKQVLRSDNYLLERCCTTVLTNVENSEGIFPLF